MRIARAATEIEPDRSICSSKSAFPGPMMLSSGSLMRTTSFGSVRGEFIAQSGPGTLAHSAIVLALRPLYPFRHNEQTNGIAHAWLSYVDRRPVGEPGRAG